MENQNNPNPRQALIRMAIVLLVAIGFVIYSYGWTVTDIDLALPQEQQRQTNVQSALQELLSPNIFDQDREVIDIYANFRINCAEDGDAIEQPTDQYNGATVVITPECAEPGDVVTVEVRNFESLAEGRVRWDPPGEDAQARPREILDIGREDFIFSDDGNFTGTIEVPRIRGTEDQISRVTVRAAVPVGDVRLSDTSEDVIDRMAETIFMALVATTVAIPIATMLSFFAARNLMRPVKLSVGSTLIAFIGLAVGIGLGALLLKPIADLGVRIGSGDEAGAAAAFLIPIGIVLGTFGISRSMFRDSGNTQNQTIVDQARSAGIRVVVAVIVVFLIGLIGGLGLLGSEQIFELSETIRNDNTTLIADGVRAIANLLGVLGELVELFTVAVGGFIGGFTLSGMMTNLFSAPLRQVNTVVGHSLGVALGAVSGLILMWFIGQIGTTAALLGLLSPIAAALIGGQIPVLIYNEFFIPKGAVYRITQIQRLTQLGLFIIGAVVIFIVTFQYLNIGRALIDGNTPPEINQNFMGASISTYVYDNMIVGAILGALAGGLAGVRANFPLGSILYNVSRTMLNTVRSIEPLIMGLVFVIWVGIGPFAGVLALTLHSIAALGKLYSEQVENIDDGPVEALNSTGASRLQTIIYAVVPQIIPPYIAFTMYRWDINVRMSTIIGFVGGGGIGLLLQQQINLLRYRDAGVAVLAIAVVVSILDYASASIRSRLT